jgi:hypothetical protein
VAQLVETTANYSYSWETYCPATVRIGPEPCSGSESLQNQCPFVRGFKLAVNERMAVFRGRVKVSSILGEKPGSILPGGKSSYIPFNDGAKRSPSGKGSGNTGFGGGLPGTHFSLEFSEDSDIVEEDVSSDDEVRLELVPGTTQVTLLRNLVNLPSHNLQVYHPLNVINQYLLCAVRSCFSSSCYFPHWRADAGCPSCCYT